LATAFSYFNIVGRRNDAVNKSTLWSTDDDDDDDDDGFVATSRGDEVVATMLRPSPTRCIGWVRFRWYPHDI
jgi:hypothetical protein